MKFYAIIEFTPDYTNITTFETREEGQKYFDKEAPEYRSDENEENTIAFGELEVGGRMYFGRDVEFTEGELIDQITPYS